jgi:peptide/nickel transport system permease protein
VRQVNKVEGCQNLQNQRKGRAILKYIIKRTLWAIPTVLGVLVLLFSLTYLLPGDPASAMLGPRATPELVEEINQRLKLNEPIHMRLLYYLTGVVRGDLGTSVWSGHTVTSLLADALPHTCLLAVASIGVAALIGIAIGTFGSIYSDHRLGFIINIVSIVGVAIPDFVAALLLILAFSVYLPWFPAIGGGEAGNLLDVAHRLVLPTAALAISWTGYLSRLTNETMKEVLDSDFIRTAKAFAAPRWIVFYKYALKNAIIPTITVIGLGVGKLLGGAVLVEIIFNRPGLGKLIVDAVYARDLPVVQGGILVASLLFVLANLLADISYAFVDPRIKYE